MMERSLIEEVASRTKDAYSWGLYYTPGQWLRITRFLFKQGYSEEEVEEILRSKYMRWANDYHPAGDQNLRPANRKVTLEDFRDYYNFTGTPRSGYRKSTKEYIEEMLAEAFADAVVAEVGK